MLQLALTPSCPEAVLTPGYIPPWLLTRMAVLEGKWIWAPQTMCAAKADRRITEEGASPVGSVWQAGRRGVPAAGGGEARGPAYFGFCRGWRWKSCWGLSWGSSVGPLTASSSNASGSNERTLNVTWRRQEDFQHGFHLLVGKGWPEGLSKAAWLAVKWKSLTRGWLFATPWTIQSVEFSRPEYWSG